MRSAQEQALAQEVADTIRAHPVYGAHRGQTVLAASVGYSSPTINAALANPGAQLTRKMLERLAGRLPDEFGWITPRLKALDYPDATGPAPGASRARDAELVDEAISQVESALEKLRAARRRI